MKSPKTKALPPLPPPGGGSDKGDDKIEFKPRISSGGILIKSNKQDIRTTPKGRGRGRGKGRGRGGGNGIDKKISSHKPPVSPLPSLPPSSIILTKDEEELNSEKEKTRVEDIPPIRRAPKVPKEKEKEEEEEEENEKEEEEEAEEEKEEKEKEEKEKERQKMNNNNSSSSSDSSVLPALPPRDRMSMSCNVPPPSALCAIADHEAAMAIKEAKKVSSVTSSSPPLLSPSSNDMEKSYDNEEVLEDKDVIHEKNVLDDMEEKSIIMEKNKSSEEIKNSTSTNNSNNQSSDSWISARRGGRWGNNRGGRGGRKGSRGGKRTSLLGRGRINIQQQDTIQSPTSPSSSTYTSDATNIKSIPNITATTNPTTIISTTTTTSTIPITSVPTSNKIEEDESESEFIRLLRTKLSCGICTNVLQEPRILSCLHAFCNNCINKVVIAVGGNKFTSTKSKTINLRCPVCNHGTEVTARLIYSVDEGKKKRGKGKREKGHTLLSPRQRDAGNNKPKEKANEDTLSTNIQVDYYRTSMTNALSSFDTMTNTETSSTWESVQLCDLCMEEEEEDDATGRCIDCNGQPLLCSLHAQLHSKMKNFRTHTVLSLKDYKAKSKSDLDDGTALYSSRKKTVSCNTHPINDITLWCQDCNVLICDACVLEEHNDHLKVLPSTVSKKMCEKIGKSMDTARTRIPEIQKTLDKIEDTAQLVEKNRLATVADVDKFIASVHKMIDTRCAAMYEMIMDVTNEKIALLNNQHTSLSNRLKAIEATNSYVNTIMERGSGVEILLTQQRMSQAMHKHCSDVWAKNPVDSGVFEFSLGSEGKALNKTISKAGRVV